jgi:cytochrome c oxidase assembly protein subunit 15
VASGLTERVSVSQYRLAFHLTLACLIYVALLWAAERIIAPAHAAFKVQEDARSLRGKDQKKEPRRIRFVAGALLALAITQIYLGALVAGLRAGLVYNTWPLIDGRLVPRSADLLFARPAWRNFFDNALTVQFDHRMMAYALLALALFHAADAYRHDKDGALATRASLLAGAIFAQATLGVLTLLRSAPIDLALMHQAAALLVLTLAAIHACRTMPRRQPAAVTPSEAPFLSPAYGGEKAQAAFSSRE